METTAALFGGTGRRGLVPKRGGAANDGLGDRFFSTRPVGSGGV